MRNLVFTTGLRDLTLSRALPSFLLCTLILSHLEPLSAAGPWGRKQSPSATNSLDPGRMMTIGSQFEKQKNYQRAATIYQQILQEHPGHLEAQKRLEQVMVHLGEPGTSSTGNTSQAARPIPTEIPNPKTTVPAAPSSGPVVERMIVRTPLPAVMQPAPTSRAIPSTPAIVDSSEETLTQQGGGAPRTLPKVAQPLNSPPRLMDSEEEDEPRFLSLKSSAKPHQSGHVRPVGKTSLTRLRESQSEDDPESTPSKLARGVAPESPYLKSLQNLSEIDEPASEEEDAGVARLDGSTESHPTEEQQEIHNERMSHRQSKSQAVLSDPTAGPTPRFLRREQETQQALKKLQQKASAEESESPDSAPVVKEVVVEISSTKCVTRVVPAPLPKPEQEPQAANPPSELMTAPAEASVIEPATAPTSVGSPTQDTEQSPPQQLPQEVAPPAAKPGKAQVQVPKLELRTGLQALCPRATQEIRRLIRSMEAPNVRVRKGSLLRLCESGKEARGALPAVRELLLDPDLSVRIVAARTLWQVNQETTGISTLVEALQTGNTEETCLAAYTLGEMGSAASEALPSLEKVTRERSGLVQLHAAEAVWRIKGGDEDALALMMQLLESSSADERWVSAYMLGASGDRRLELIQRLSCSLGDKNATVRSSAIYALGCGGTSLTAKTTRRNSFLERAELEQQLRETSGLELSNIEPLTARRFPK